jgi:Domain of unknown function (DUF5667)
MKPLPERLNDRLSRGQHHRGQGEPDSGDAASILTRGAPAPEVDELLSLAWRLQAAPQLQADPDFAQQLERRLLVRQAALNRAQSAPRRFPLLWNAHPALGLALALCLLVLVLGTGMLIAAAQVSDPANPLYAVKRWEQGMQVSLANSATSQATLHLQFASERLRSLAVLAGQGNDEAYQRALFDFDEQLGMAASAIASLPAGPERDHLNSQLNGLEDEARHTLRTLLPHLDVPERVITTGELGKLGEAVPRVLRVEITIPAQPGGRAIISISGSNIQPGAQLLVDGQVVEGTGAFEHGAYVVTVNWNGNQHPRSIGILNPDATAAQTDAIAMNTPNGNGSGSNGTDGKGTHGNGNGRGKPTMTPTPHH